MAVYGTLQGGREVLLTFDDGPSTTCTPKLLDLLAKENIKGSSSSLASELRPRVGKTSFGGPLTRVTASEVTPTATRT